MDQHTGPRYSAVWIRDQLFMMGGIGTFTEICRKTAACRSTVARSLHYGVEAGTVINLGRDYMIRCIKCGDPTTNEQFCDDCETNA